VALRYSLIAAHSAALFQAKLRRRGRKPGAQISWWDKLATQGLEGVVSDWAEGIGQRLEEGIWLSYDALAEPERWARQEGAALVTAGLASLQLGQVADAQALGRAATDRGNTMGALVQAAALPAGSFSARAELLGKLDRRDRRYYFGAAHGDVWIFASTGERQMDRAGRLVKRLMAD
jgi:hypothetical protein